MARRRFLVAYDIRQPARLRKVFKIMKSFGEPLQYSVFLCDLNCMEKTHLVAQVTDAIKHTEDSVAIVDLGEAAARGTVCLEFLGTRRPLPASTPPVL